MWMYAVWTYVRTCDSTRNTKLDNLKHLLNVDDTLLGETNNIDVLLRVFAWMQDIALVQQIEEFPAVDLIE